MPTPKEDETEEEFIARCVPIVMEDETAETNKQAVAICYSMWRQAQEEKEVKRGLYLAEPHGHLTASGKKRAIAKADELELEGKYVLVSKDKAYGIIDLSASQAVTIKEFDERFDEHRVTTKERKKWWDGKDELYLYEIKDFEEFDPPREVEVPDNVKFIIREVQFKDNGAGEELEMATETKVVLGAQSLEMLIEEIGMAFRSSSVVEALPELDKMGYSPWVAATYPALNYLITEWKNEWYQVNFIKQDGDYQFASFNEWIPVEKLEEWVVKLKAIKAVTKTESDGEHPASHYLVVEDPEKVTTWHLRVKNMDGDLDHRLMGASWAALHEGYRGNVYEGPGKQAAIAKLKKFYDQEDMELPGEKAGRRIRGEKVDILKTLHEKFNDVMATIKDLISFADYDDQKPKEWFEKAEGIKSLKLKDGRAGLLTWTTNAFKDREDEIFTTKSLEDLVDRYFEKEVKGIYDFWHIPGSDFADVIWQGVSGRFLAEIGIFHDSEVGQAFKQVFIDYPDGHPEVAPEGWGCSHGFKYRSEDRADGVYEWFDKEKSTVLPASAAANPYNPKLEVLQMDKKQKNALSTLLGDEMAETIDAKGESETKRLEEAGVAHKSKDNEKKEVEAAVEKKVDEPKSEDEVKDKGEKDSEPTYLTFDDVKEGFEGFAEVLKGIVADVSEMKASLKTLTESDEAKFERKVELTPKESLKAIAESVIGKKETLVDGRTTLGKDGPEEAEPMTESLTGVPLIDNIKARNAEHTQGLSFLKPSE